MDFTREQLAAAYIKDHNGVRRPALRAMERDLAKGTIRMSVMEHLYGEDEVA